MMKTYGWLSPKKLEAINGNPEIVSLLYNLGLLPEEISARVRGYVEEERERCAKIAEGFHSRVIADAIRDSSEGRAV